MSTTKNIVFKKDPRNPEMGYLRLRTITNRKPTEKSLNIKIHKKHWNNNKQRVYSTEPNAKQYNEQINKIKSENPEAKASSVKKSNINSFFDFAEKKLEVIHKKSTRDMKLYSLNKVKEYVQSEGKDDLLFSEITPLFIEKYYNYLRTTMNKQNSVVAYMINFRYFVNEADKYEEYSYQKDPFKNLKLKKEKTNYSVMTPYEVELFFEYEPQDKFYLQVQNAFGFSMHTAGMRISDLFNLRWSNFKQQGDSYYVEYYMQKTNRHMHPKLNIDSLQYLLPFIEEYGKEYSEGYSNLKKEIERDKKTLEEFRKELKELQPMSIYEVYTAGKEKYQEKLLEGMERHNKEKNLKRKIKLYKEGIETNKKALVDFIAHACLRLKEKYPNDTVIPQLRGVAKEDIKKVQHNLKVSFNYRLQMIQREQGIKTKITNHQARHLFAQRLFEAGANFHYISLNLGHASLSITEAYREQLINDEEKSVIDIFSDLMKKPDDEIENEPVTQKYITLPNGAFPSINTEFLKE